jgi:hypothetical protein
MTAPVDVPATRSMPSISRGSSLISRPSTWAVKRPRTPPPSKARMRKRRRTRLLDTSSSVRDRDSLVGVLLLSPVPTSSRPSVSAAAARVVRSSRLLARSSLRASCSWLRSLATSRARATGSWRDVENDMTRLLRAVEPSRRPCSTVARPSIRAPVRGSLSAFIRVGADECYLAAPRSRILHDGADSMRRSRTVF